MARPCNSLAFWSVDCPYRRRFRVLVRALSRCYGISLFVPTFPGSPDKRFSSFKRFLSDPIEGKRHPWDGCYGKLSRVSRLSIYHSLFLFRKVLPASVPSISDFLDKVSSPPPEADPLFLEFVRREVPRLFREGWARGYDSAVQRSILSTSACAERGRARGGCRMYWLEKYEREAREEFCSSLYDSKAPSSVPPSRLIATDTGGKVRLLTVPPARYACLQPLHTIMYDHLSRFKWLLRGDAKATRFKDFCRKEGEVFVSGDYESATDSLNSEIQKEILRLVLQSASLVPNGVKQLAMASLSSELTYRGEGSPPRTVRLANGQMMGFPLSFPLLCIVNYLAFRYATMDETIPVKINGDDIVFRSKPCVASRWMASVGSSGLKLSVGKTMVDRTYFTLNSTLFRSVEGKVTLVPFVRSKALFGKDDSFCSVPGRYASFCPGYTGKRRLHLRSVFLRQNIGFIERSGRSLTRGLGMNVSEEVLRGSRLWYRECSILSLPAEKPPPAPRSLWEQHPEGYEIKHSEKPYVYTKEEREELVEAVVAAAWKPPRDLDYEEEYTGFVKVPALDYSKMSRLLGISLKEVQRKIRLRNEAIFSDYMSKRRKLFPYWSKKVNRLVPVIQSSESEEERVVKISLGRGTLWDCRGNKPPRLLQSMPGCKVKIFRKGFGIGPPTGF